jgi:3-methylcrotonyl-CoA carboxylase alpha subunit
VFKKLLIANRGEIACRIMRTAHDMGIATVAVYSDADRDALHVQTADEAVHIGPAPAAQSYLRGDLILEVARHLGVDAIHPGYGFLSENTGFARACAAAGITFVGPTPEVIEAMGLKDRAKAVAVAAGAPVLPGYWDADQSDATLKREADRIGYPLLIKAVAGGGGRGIRQVGSASEFDDALASARREAKAAFTDDRMMLEKLVLRPRHVEVQVFGDTHGNVVHLFERDCSIQRRRQKLIEEAPAPGMTDAVRTALTGAALKIARAVGYTNAGTVEFVADGTGPLTPDGFWFLEMNTRLQVEHPVTEAITGLDLVEWQLRVAAGEPLPLQQDDITLTGHAIEARIVAEDAEKGFLPSSGTIQQIGDSWYEAPEGVRIDAGYEDGAVVPDSYDSLLAKVIAHHDTRDEARLLLSKALGEMQTDGVTINAGYLRRLLDLDVFASGAVHTGAIDDNAATLARPPLSDPRRIGLAGLVAHWVADLNRALDAPAVPASAFVGSRGWRMNAPPSHRISLTVDGTPCTMAVEDDGTMLSVQVDGATTVLSREHLTMSGGADDCLCTIETGHGITPLPVRVTAAGVTVFEGGEAYVYPFANPEAGDDTAEAADDIKAPLPGRIAIVQAAAGDTVSKGQVLLVLEAMKMEHALAAPRDGVLGEIRVIAGQQVKAGDLLAALAPPQA